MHYKLGAAPLRTSFIDSELRVSVLGLTLAPDLSDWHESLHRMKMRVKTWVPTESAEGADPGEPAKPSNKPQEMASESGNKIKSNLFVSFCCQWLTGCQSQRLCILPSGQSSLQDTAAPALTTQLCGRRAQTCSRTPNSGWRRAVCRDPAPPAQLSRW